MFLLKYLSNSETIDDLVTLVLQLNQNEIENYIGIKKEIPNNKFKKMKEKIDLLQSLHNKSMLKLEMGKNFATIFSIPFGQCCSIGENNTCFF